MRVVTIITAHNRTHHLRRTLLALQEYGPTQNQVILVADQSPPSLIHTAYEILGPRLTLIQTETSLYWAKSIALGELRAKTTSPDYILWLNEDSFLQTPIPHLFIPGQITVGTFHDETGKPFRGGLKQHPCKLHYSLLPPNSECDTFNGNCVAIPRAIYQQLSITEYQHAFADIDYGLSAKRLGIPIRSSNPVGFTPRPIEPHWKTLKSLRQRIRACLSPKGLPPDDWWSFVQKHSQFPILKPLLFLSPYRHIFFRQIQPPTDHAQSKPSPQHP